MDKKLYRVFWQRLTGVLTRLSAEEHTELLASIKNIQDYLDVGKIKVVEITPLDYDEARAELARQLAVSSLP